MEDRKKTTIMLPADLVRELGELSDELGVSRNAVLSMAAALFITHVAAVIEPMKRRKTLAAIEGVFQRLLEKARATV